MRGLFAEISETWMSTSISPTRSGVINNEPRHYMTQAFVIRNTLLNYYWICNDGHGPSNKMHYQLLTKKSKVLMQLTCIHIKLTYQYLITSVVSCCYDI